MKNLHLVIAVFTVLFASLPFPAKSLPIDNSEENEIIEKVEIEKIIKEDLQEVKDKIDDDDEDDDEFTDGVQKIFSDFLSFLDGALDTVRDMAKDRNAMDKIGSALRQGSKGAMDIIEIGADLAQGAGELLEDVAKFTETLTPNDNKDEDKTRNVLN